MSREEIKKQVDDYEKNYQSYSVDEQIEKIEYFLSVVKIVIDNFTNGKSSADADLLRRIDTILRTNREDMFQRLVNNLETKISNYKSMIENRDKILDSLNLVDDDDTLTAEDKVEWKDKFIMLLGKIHEFGDLEAGIETCETELKELYAEKYNKGNDS